MGQVALKALLFTFFYLVNCIMLLIYNQFSTVSTTVRC